MESIVITVKDKSELQFLEYLAKKMGFAAFELSEQDKRLLARRKLLEIAQDFPSIDISEEEIQQEVEAVRAANYVNKSH
ncbi:MAG: hypothetical protein SFU99_00210 [Saprospiraceae bacterium]|nr:hypothetical protein [Saprospiraceae bacterium]